MDISTGITTTFRLGTGSAAAVAELVRRLDLTDPPKERAECADPIVGELEVDTTLVTRIAWGTVYRRHRLGVGERKEGENDQEGDEHVGGDQQHVCGQRTILATTL
jgi:hypothetical protein